MDELYMHIGRLVVENNKMAEIVQQLKANIIELNTQNEQLKQLCVQQREGISNEAPVVAGYEGFSYPSNIWCNTV